MKVHSCPVPSRQGLHCRMNRKGIALGVEQGRTLMVPMGPPAPARTADVREALARLPSLLRRGPRPASWAWPPSGAPTVYAHGGASVLCVLPVYSSLSGFRSTALLRLGCHRPQFLVLASTTKLPTFFQGYPTSPSTVIFAAPSRGVGGGRASRAGAHLRGRVERRRPVGFAPLFTPPKKQGFQLSLKPLLL